MVGDVRALCIAVLALAGPAVAADLVFRVPEVSVRHAAADRPVGTAAQAAPAGGSSSPRYEEYFVEHEVSTSDARHAARELVLADDDQPGPGCGECGPREREYCSSRMLGDHCCCERRHAEPLPWLPHTCYSGPAVCRARAGNCARYARLRDCCCLQTLARKWKGILASAPKEAASTGLLAVTLLMAVVGRL